MDEAKNLLDSDQDDEMVDLEKVYDIQPVLKPMEYEEIRNL